MDVAERLVKKAQELEQRAAHHAERAEHREDLNEKLTAVGFTFAAIAIREVALALAGEEAEDLAA